MEAKRAGGWMTSQIGKDRIDWRGAVIGGVAGGVFALSLLTGFGVTTAFAQPAEPAGPSAEDKSCTGEDCAKNDAAEAQAACPEGEEECPEGEAAAPKVNADQVLSQIHAEYAQGDGGGQISKLIDDAMKLRGQGFRPSNANATALADALEYRPNQTPLVEALKETIAYQRKLQAQAQMSIAEGPVAGPVPVIPPQGGINIPLG
jgi:hypothetical protein